MAKTVHQKAYDKLTGKLDNMSKGATKHHADTVDPIPSSINAAKYDDLLSVVVTKFGKATTAQTATDLLFIEAHAEIKTVNTMLNNDARVVKGVYGPTSPTNKDYGIKPDKKRTKKPVDPPVTP